MRKPPDNIPRGWLKEELAKRTVKAKVTDPKEIERIMSQDPPELRLGPGADTVRRRGRYSD
jgi:hypothetical protein